MLLHSFCQGIKCRRLHTGSRVARGRLRDEWFSLATVHAGERLDCEDVNEAEEEVKLAFSLAFICLPGQRVFSAIIFNLCLWLPNPPSTSFIRSQSRLPFLCTSSFTSLTISNNEDDLRSSSFWPRLRGSNCQPFLPTPSNCRRPVLHGIARSISHLRTSQHRMRCLLCLPQPRPDLLPGTLCVLQVFHCASFALPFSIALVHLLYRRDFRVQKV